MLTWVCSSVKNRKMDFFLFSSFWVCECVCVLIFQTLISVHQQAFQLACQWLMMFETYPTLQIQRKRCSYSMWHWWQSFAKMRTSQLQRNRIKLSWCSIQYRFIKINLVLILITITASQLWKWVVEIKGLLYHRTCQTFSNHFYFWLFVFFHIF